MTKTLMTVKMDLTGMSGRSQTSLHALPMIVDTVDDARTEAGFKWGLQVCLCLLRRTTSPFIVSEPEGTLGSR